MAEAPTSSTESDDRAQLLRIYLQDHRAAAGAGLALVRRVARNNRGTPFEATLARLSAQVSTDVETLDEILAALGLAPHTPKVALALMAERVGRFKPNGRLRSYSPLSRLLELEGLEAGINAKRMLWRALGPEAHRYPALNRFDLAVLEQRAVEQSRSLEEIHLEAARLALGTSTTDR
jgi:hypothetical protein